PDGPANSGNVNAYTSGEREAKDVDNTAAEERVGHDLAAEGWRQCVRAEARRVGREASTRGDQAGGERRTDAIRHPSRPRRDAAQDPQDPDVGSSGQGSGAGPPWPGGGAFATGPFTAGGPVPGGRDAVVVLPASGGTVPGVSIGGRTAHPFSGTEGSHTTAW